MSSKSPNKINNSMPRSKKLGQPINKKCICCGHNKCWTNRSDSKPKYNFKCCKCGKLQ